MADKRYTFRGKAVPLFRIGGTPVAEYSKRAAFYACRLISSQKEREFEGKDYNSIKKIYSIWICMDSPNRDSYINRYRLEEKHLLHRYDEPQENMTWSTSFLSA